MAAYVIVEIEITDPVLYERYKELAGPSVSGCGGKYIVRGGTVQVLEGEWDPKRVVVLQFDTVEQARAWWNSESYRPAREIRQKCALTKMLLVEGV